MVMEDVQLSQFLLNEVDAPIIGGAAVFVSPSNEALKRH